MKRSDGEIVADDQEQADILNQFYASVFTKSHKNVPSVERRAGPELTEIAITEEDVREAMGAIKEGSAPGPDGLSTRLLIGLKEELVKPLTILFRKSMEDARIPDEWRDAIVTPIFKKGKKTEPGNYRPVSLTSVFGKTLERIVKKHLVQFIEGNALLRDTQHGFRPGRSVQTNLTDFLNQPTKWTDEGRLFDVLYLDFQKAFDKVDHQRLTVK